MAGIRQEPFGKTADGHEIMRYWLSDGVISVGILNLGGTIQSVLVPDRSGKMIDVALGYDDVHSYEVQDKFIGALIGRFGNRIARGKFSLDGKDYTLRTNDGRNHLHGGQGFDKRLWNVQTDGDSLVLTLTSPDGDEGYPGTLQVCVRYTVANRALIIDYQAQTDAPTLCNLTNHAYWNLSGHDAGSVGDQKITLNADYFTPVDNEAIPLGTLAPVTGTALDLRTPTAIGAHWDDPDEQLQNVGGYDHNFALRGSIGFLSPTAEVTSPATGITMQVAPCPACSSIPATRWKALPRVKTVRFTDDAPASAWKPSSTPITSTAPTGHRPSCARVRFGSTRPSTASRQSKFYPYTKRTAQAHCPLFISVFMKCHKVHHRCAPDK